MAQERTSFDVPPDMRRMAEQSVEQARQAFDGFIAAAHRTISSIEEQTTSAQANMRAMGEKAMGYAEKNVMTSFDFAQKVVRAKDLQEIMQLQAEFIRAQMQNLTQQAQELGQSAAKATMDAARPKGTT